MRVSGPIRPRLCCPSESRSGLDRQARISQVSLHPRRCEDYQRRLACYSSHPEKLFGCFQNESERPPHRFPQDSNLPDGLSNAPRASESRWKESEIARTEPAFLATFVAYEGLAGEEKDGFILVVVPFEGSRSAIPNDNSGGPVVARR